jgi:hypothetical protein
LELHRVELDKKLRLPDPAKAMEGVWKLLRKTRQQINVHGTTVTVSPVSRPETLKAQKLAKIDADRKKGLGTSYAVKATIR